jgi:phage gp36-like protein
MPYCTIENLSDWILPVYLDKLEEIKPGIVQSHIDRASAEIDDHLRERYVLPLTAVPETIRRICAVMAAYRSAGAITSLVDTEASSGNEWIPLQTEYKRAVSDLAAIRAGKIDLGLDVLGNESAAPEEIRVAAPTRIFGPDTWKSY